MGINNIVKCAFFVCINLYYLVHAFYETKSDVIKLTESNFKDKVLGSDSLWIVEFYAPWCGHCQSLVPEYQKAAEALKGSVKFGAIDCDEHKSLPGEYGVRGFPTIKIFHSDIKGAQDYSGPRTAQGMVDAAIKNVKEIAYKRMGNGGSSKRSKKDTDSGGDNKDIIVLTDNNFSQIFDDDSGAFWLVEFFAPWCGHCKALAPEWSQAATHFKGQPVKFAMLDSTVNTIMSSKYGINGYPTIKVFHPIGNGKEVDPDEYDGGRQFGGIKSWVENQLADKMPPPEVLQITSEKILREACDKNKLCIVSFLPHILDCNAECRNRYLSILKEIATENKKNLLGWIWSEAGQQPELEGALEIGGFGYPAMAAVNSKKKVFTILKGPFSENGIKEFIRDINYGKAGTLAPVHHEKFSKIKSISPWDGQDGKLEEEEEIVFKAGKDEF